MVFVPPMTGVGTDEPLLQAPKIDQLLGLGRPGEVLRNLLADANHDEAAVGNVLRAAIVEPVRLPTASPGYHRRAHSRGITRRVRQEERPLTWRARAAVFQQVLMLLTAAPYPARRRGIAGTKPDAHLHMILQDAIFHELRSAAARHGSQIIAATHSEVVINAVEPRELLVTLSQPRLVADNAERSRLITSLRVLDNADVMQALDVRGVLYVEDYTDINILRAWAETLEHRALSLLTIGVDVETDRVSGTRGATRPGDHRARSLCRPATRARRVARDRAARRRRATDDPGLRSHGCRACSESAGGRYEIESYLLHPHGSCPLHYTASRFGIQRSRTWMTCSHIGATSSPPAVTRAPTWRPTSISTSPKRARNCSNPCWKPPAFTDWPYTPGTTK